MPPGSEDAMKEIGNTITMPLPLFEISESLGRGGEGRGREGRGEERRGGGRRGGEGRGRERRGGGGRGGARGME